MYVTNIHGKKCSTLSLFPKVTPVCSEDQKWTYGSGRGQQVNVSCEVETHPEAQGFRWAFNTSTEMVYIPKNRTYFDHNRSVMAYTPRTHHDFGTLLCWADNEVGSQPQPCVYLVVPACECFHCLVSLLVPSSDWVFPPVLLLGPKASLSPCWCLQVSDSLLPYTGQRRR